MPEQVGGRGAEEGCPPTWSNAPLSVRWAGVRDTLPHLLTITGQEHGPVHQVLQGLPEQLAGGQGGLQVQETLQHGQQPGRCGGAAHLGGEEKDRLVAAPFPGEADNGFRPPGTSAPSLLCASQGPC